MSIRQIRVFLVVGLLGSTALRANSAEMSASDSSQKPKIESPLKAETPSASKAQAPSKEPEGTASSAKAAPLSAGKAVTEKAKTAQTRSAAAASNPTAGKAGSEAPAKAAAPSTEKTAAEAPSSEWIIVTGETCNLRSGPSKSNDVVEVLGKFSPLKRLGETSNEYIKVQTKSGKTGWAHTSVVGQSAYVSLNGDLAHLRKSPGKDSPIEFDLVQRHYPLRVLDREDGYVKVADWEDDQGWLHESVLSPKRYCIVKAAQANVRSGAGEQFDVLFRAEKKVFFEVLAIKGDWVEVKHEDGGQGWVWASVLWGVDAPKGLSTQEGG